MGKYHQGFYKPLNPSKYSGDINNIVYRSSWEKRFMLWCDKNPSVVKWGSEIYPIQYYSQVDQKVRRYFVDFFIKMRNSEGIEETLMIEIKPNKERFPPTQPKKKSHKAMQRYLDEQITYQRNQDKWKYAEAFAKKNGMKFLVMDEYNLGVKKRK